MTDIIHKTKVFTPEYRDAKKAHIPNIQAYKEMYDHSIQDPDRFWAKQAQRLDWYKKWRKKNSVTH